MKVSELFESIPDDMKGNISVQGSKVTVKGKGNVTLEYTKVDPADTDSELTESKQYTTQANKTVTATVLAKGTVAETLTKAGITAVTKGVTAGKVA